MSLQRDDASWLQRGRQRQAVAQVLRKPMTAKEIYAAARILGPRIQLRDVWHLLRELQNRQLVTCRNPRLVTGKLYELTDSGKRTVRTAFGIVIAEPPRDVDWRRYSHVVRARVRRLSLLALADLESRTQEAQTATLIRKQVCAQHPVALNPVLRAVKKLVALGLVREAGVTRQRCCKLYRLTSAARGSVTSLGY